MSTATTIEQALVGFKAQRGGCMGKLAASGVKYFDGPVPHDELHQLFSWVPAEGPVETTLLLSDGVTRITDHARKVICRPPGAFGSGDEGAVLGVFKSGYQPHPYLKYLHNVVEVITERNGIPVAGAGMPKGGANAWVEFALPDPITTPEDVTFKPYLLTGTSLDGTLATTYNTMVNLLVCDNQIPTIFSKKNGAQKVKHTTHSLGKLADVANALGLIENTAEAFQQLVARLTAWKIDDSAFNRYLDAVASLKDKDGQEKKGKAKTLAEKKRTMMRQFWTEDPRVAPWAGTAFGVFQCDSTWRQHGQIVRGMQREERNVLNSLDGTTGKRDQQCLMVLRAVA